MKKGRGGSKTPALINFLEATMFNQNQNFMNAVDITALLIGIINLCENRKQTSYNDVHTANDEQAQLLPDELGKRLDRRDAIISRILELLDCYDHV